MPLSLSWLKSISLTASKRKSVAFGVSPCHHGHMTFLDPWTELGKALRTGTTACRIPGHWALLQRGESAPSPPSVALSPLSQTSLHLRLLVNPSLFCISGLQAPDDQTGCSGAGLTCHFEGEHGSSSRWHFCAFTGISRKQSKNGCSSKRRRSNTLMVRISGLTGEKRALSGARDLSNYSSEKATISAHLGWFKGDPHSLNSAPSSDWPVSMSTFCKDNRHEPTVKWAG